MNQQFKSIEENFAKIMAEKQAVLNGNSSAGTRVRALLSEVKKDTHELRGLIQADKNQRAAKKSKG
jgi:hypothetical protein